MNSVNARSNLPGYSVVSKVVFTVLSLVALYYLYQFLFSTSGLEGRIVLGSIKAANADAPIVTTADKLPALYEGGEYSINTWIYINDYSINRGRNKHVLSIGGSTFLTLAVFLGPFKNSLHVRVHTSGTTTAVQQGSTGPSASSTGPDNLSVENQKVLFDTVQTESTLLDGNRPCDVQSVELQKWIQVTVTLNNKTCDVYIDGKLARSCILPSFYRVDKSNLLLTQCAYKGFGGFVSNTSAYNYALNPEQVWRLYMTGPGPQYSFWDYVTSLFDPKAAMQLDYPKQNITQ